MVALNANTTAEDARQWVAALNGRWNAPIGARTRCTRGAIGLRAFAHIVSYELTPLHHEEVEGAIREDSAR